jgi:hypothetical protein
VHIQRVLRPTPVRYRGQRLFVTGGEGHRCKRTSSVKVITQARVEMGAPSVKMGEIQREVPCREAVVPALAAGILVTRLIRIQCQIVPELNLCWRTCRGASRC